MDLELTIDDPVMYTRPFTVKSTEVIIPDSDVLEYVCSENEKDRTHLGKIEYEITLASARHRRKSTSSKNIN